MRLSRRIQACFFYEKILRAQKHSEANKNEQNKIKQTLNNKGNNFSCAQTSKRLNVFYFRFWGFLYAQNLFVKKINRLEIVLITSFYYNTQEALQSKIIFEHVF